MLKGKTMSTKTNYRAHQDASKDGKQTLVLGASLKPQRHSNMAINMLRDYGHPVLALGLREGQVADVEVEKDRAAIAGEDVHTVTLYMNAYRQDEFQDFILDLNPERIIFNPGAENRELLEKAEERGIVAMEACTLVMLSIGRY